MLFIPQVNTTHYGIKSLRYNGLLFGMAFSDNSSNNPSNTGISKFENKVKDLLIIQFSID